MPPVDDDFEDDTGTGTNDADLNGPSRDELIAAAEEAMRAEGETPT